MVDNVDMSKLNDDLISAFGDIENKDYTDTREWFNKNYGFEPSDELLIKAQKSIIAGLSNALLTIHAKNDDDDHKARFREASTVADSMIISLMSGSPASAKISVALQSLDPAERVLLYKMGGVYTEILGDLSL